MKNLTISIKGEKPHIDIIKEMMNHLGLIYETWKSETNYPCEIEIVDDFKESKQKRNKLLILTNFLQKNAIGFLAGKSKGANDTPLLNFYEEILLKNIRDIFADQNLPLVRKWQWPDFKRCAIVFTHDIDSIFQKHSWHRTTSLPDKIILSIKNFLPNFDKGYFRAMLLFLQKHKINSTFFFFPTYDNHRHFKEILKDVGKHHELGLHSLANSESDLEKEIERLNAVCNRRIHGVRMHLLKLRVPDSWKEMEKYLQYDMSLFKNQRFGYRAGLCHPFHPLIENRLSSLLEIPTLFMDWTALDQDMNSFQIRKKLFEIIKFVEKFNGCLSLNYHNEYFNTKGFSSIMKSLEFVTGYANKHDYWKATAIEVNNWWRLREGAKVKLILTDDDFIRGSSKAPMPLIIEYLNKRQKFKAKGRFSVKWER